MRIPVKLSSHADNSAMRTMLLITVLLAIPAHLCSDTIFVPADYPTIQQAIDAAVNGDLIRVSLGTYYENIDFQGKPITVEGDGGAKNVTIDGNQAGSVASFMNGEGVDSVLTGFTLTNGNGYFDSTYNLNVGGGVFITYSSPTLSMCIIQDNQSERGGGVYCKGMLCHAIIDGCVISSNIAGRGGGVHSVEANPVIRNSVIQYNIAEDTFGGGIEVFNGGSPHIINNLIRWNISVFRGGGIYSSASPTPTIEYNSIIGNISQCGGGIQMYDGEIIGNSICGNMAKNPTDPNPVGGGGGIAVSGSNSIVRDNVISQNNAFIGGGGVLWSAASGILENNLIYDNSASGSTAGHCRGGGIDVGHDCHLNMTNCVIFNNNASDHGGGIDFFYFSSGTIRNCTLINNEATNGSGMHMYEHSTASASNSIFWNDPTNEIVSKGDLPIIVHSDVAGGWIGTGNIDDDPLFADPSNGDYHLTFPSPCRNSGDNAAVTEPYDFEGDPRIAYGTVDMGADEFHTHLYITGDLATGGSIQGKFVGLPGSNPVGLFIGSGILSSPMSTMWGEYWLQAPWFLFPLVPIPSNGILELPTTLPVSIPAPYDIPMQALIGLNSDSFTNLCVLEVR
jgi:hypothetical protein